MNAKLSAKIYGSAVLFKKLDMLLMKIIIVGLPNLRYFFCKKLIGISIVCLGLVCAPGPSQAESADVVIYGSTPAGIMAAIAVKQAGLAPIILAEDQHTGGIMTSGLGASDHCHPRFVTGLSREFFRRIGKAYGKQILWRFEPQIAQRVFDTLLAEYNIKLVQATPVKTVTKSANRISEIMTQNGQKYSGQMFIDASYAGDLLARAGVSYRIGRESRSEFNEANAGIHPPLAKHQFPVAVSALAKKNQLLPGIQAGLEPFGNADDKTMAYNFRLCVTTRPDNMVPIPEPKNFNPLEYELLARWLEQQPNTRLKEIFLFLNIPNGKYDLNNNGPFSTDFIGGNWDYAEASYTEREQIVERHAEYTKGLFYFLRTSPRVPKRLRDLTAQLGLCKDEFIENEHWPPLLYVRVARRMQGRYMLTQNDMDSSVVQPDSVAIGVCPIESHSVQRVVLDGKVINEGWAAKRVTPYQIPYRSITPLDSEAENLLVPVAVSASHIAYSSLRMEPVFMALGEVAGLAAVEAIKELKTVQQIELTNLHATMRKRKMRINPPGRTSSKSNL